MIYIGQCLIFARVGQSSCVPQYTVVCIREGLCLLRDDSEKCGNLSHCKLYLYQVRECAAAPLGSNLVLLHMHSSAPVSGSVCLCSRATYTPKCSSPDPAITQGLHFLTPQAFDTWCRAITRAIRRARGNPGKLALPNRLVVQELMLILLWSPTTHQQSRISRSLPW